MKDWIKKYKIALLAGGILLFISAISVVPWLMGYVVV